MIIFQIVRTTLVMVTGLMSAYIETYKMNASSEIKASNKVLANMQLSKMTSRSGLAGDKSLPTLKRSPAMDAYIVGATSYDIPGATNTANQLAVKRKKTHQENLMIASGVFAAMISIASFDFIIAVLIITIIMITFLIKQIKPEVTTILIMGLATNSIVGTALSMVLILLELSKPNNDTDTVRRLMYTSILCLTSI